MLINKLIDLLYPPRCIFCNTIINTGNSMCQDCVKEIPFIDEKRCNRCGAGISKCVCSPIINHYDRAAAPFYYEKAAQKLVVNFKNSGNLRIAKIATSFMAECCKRHYSKVAFDYIVPVPTSYISQVKRGHNHTKILAKCLSKQLNIEVKNALGINRFTRKQKKFGKLERLANICNSYKLKRVKVKDKVILLVDDVKTTGATLNECAKILKKAGAKKVYCITLALTTH